MKTAMQTQILTMLALQDSMNTKVHPAWREQPELLAHGKNPRHPAGHVQCMAEGTGVGQRQGLVVQGAGIYLGSNIHTSSSEPTR